MPSIGTALDLEILGITHWQYKGVEAIYLLSLSDDNLRQQ